MKQVQQVRNLTHLDRDVGYRWSDVDPILEFIRNDITDSGWPTAYVAERSGLSASTIRNIQNGRTRHPANTTVDAVLRALGWERPIRHIASHEEEEVLAR